MSREVGKCDYGEGDAFVVPLPDVGYAVGVVARSDQSFALGYFFGPRLSEMPTSADISAHEYVADSAVYVKIFSDKAIRDCRWPVLGRLPRWDLKSFPLPIFGRELPLGRGYVAEEFSETNLGLPRRRRGCAKEEYERLPKSGIAGTGAVELVLGNMLPVSDGD